MLGHIWKMLFLTAGVVVLTSADYTENQLKDLVQRKMTSESAFYNFNHPGGQQMAVLLLIRPQEVKEAKINGLTMRPPMANAGTSIHREDFVSPSLEANERGAKNYLVARPRGKDHAEMLLCENFDHLLQLYRGYFKTTAIILKNDPKAKWLPEYPGMILLYTWSTPCPDCAKCLIRLWHRFQREVREKSKVTLVSRFVVAYSHDKHWRGSGMDVSTNEETRKGMKDSGINVIQVDVVKPPQPKPRKKEHKIDWDKVNRLPQKAKGGKKGRGGG